MTTKQAGDAAEDRALAHLEAAGLRLVARNYRTPGRGGREIDLVMRDRDGTLVFVEVRRRASAGFRRRRGQRPALKQRRVVFAAGTLRGCRRQPPCRFDVRRARRHRHRVAARGVRRFLIPCRTASAVLS